MAEEVDVQWETIADRHHRVRSTRVARLPTGEEAGRLISTADLRALIERDYEQLVVSLYLNLAPDEVVRRIRPHLNVFNSMRHREEESRRELIESQPRQHRDAVRSDLDETEELLNALEPQGMRSVVIFKSGRQLNRVVTLPVRVADSLTIEATPYVEPLWAILDRAPRCLVVEARKEESRLWTYHLGRLVAVGSTESFVPTDTVDRGRPGRMQRHRLTHLRWHFRATAATAARLFAERRLDLLVLAGDEDVLAELEPFLPEALRGRIAGRINPDPRADREDWREGIEQVLAERRRAEEEAAVERLGDAIGRRLLVGGLPNVIDAANQFMVRRLAVSTALSEPGFACREHHFLSLAGGDCPFCGRALVPSANVVDELIEFASLHGVELTLVQERPELLDRYGGVAAVTYWPPD